MNGHKFLNKTKKIALSQVNFKEYFEFYKDFICPSSYKYILEDKTEREIKFHEEYFNHLLVKELKIVERNIEKK